ncbi:MAG: hypothetical protein OXN17_07475 [Candidatus Poribacteria bacterium]|nr:hypothetical protein [Candidatus Poribacteria bacterium]
MWQRNVRARKKDKGNALAAADSKGELITCGKLVPPSDSILWSLRAEQDRHFLLRNPSDYGDLLRERMDTVGL